jgi:hypothetical protein
MGGAAALSLLANTLAGIAYAGNPNGCRVIVSSGICLVQAVDPGRPGGPSDSARIDPPKSRTDAPVAGRRRNGSRPNQALARVRADAQRYTDTLRAKLLGVAPPAPAPAAAARPAPRRAGAAQGASANSAESLRRAVEELDLPAARIELSSRGEGFVGAPVWLWLAGGQAMTGPRSATAAVGDAAVTATAHLVSVEWTLGPPGARVTCRGPGTPWTGQGGPSPDCGYVYALRSLPERTGGTGRWPIVATTHWQVDWQGVSAGAPVAGQQTLQLASTTDLAVGELQALVTGGGS